MKSIARVLATLAVAAVVTAPAVFETEAQQTTPRTRPAGPPPTSFKDDVMPILRNNCLECHQPGGAGYEKSGFDMRSYDGVMKGTRHGAVVIPKEPEFSTLMRLLDGRVAQEIQMPHNARRLPQEHRALIRRWIIDGAQNN
jgi:hypothetical protein